MSPTKAENRILWYTRKAKEFSRMPYGERKTRRYERLMCYKQELNKLLGSTL